MAYAVYSQNNPAWKNDKLGSSKWTMGQAGCFVTSMAVVATNLGFPTTPAQMLSKLVSRGLINSNGDIVNANALCVVYPGIKLLASKTWPSQKADLSFLDANTIIEIDDSPAAGMQTHFMPVRKVVGSDVQVMDVWDGTTRNVGAYGARWTPPVSAAAIIYAAYKYGHVAPAAAPNPNITKAQLEKVYSDLLHRVPDPGAYTHYVGRYTLAFVENDVKNSVEYKKRHAAPAPAVVVPPAEEKPVPATVVNEPEQAQVPVAPLQQPVVLDPSKEPHEALSDIVSQLPPPAATSEPADPNWFFNLLNLIKEKLGLK